MNIDFSRRNLDDIYLQELLRRNNLSIAWDLQVAEPDNTYADFSYMSFSCIDHFILSKDLSRSVTKVSVHLDALNLSNHRPVIMDLQAETMCLNSCMNASKKQNGIAWHKIGTSDSRIDDY